jgi:hypothetical protein
VNSSTHPTETDFKYDEYPLSATLMDSQTKFVQIISQHDPEEMIFEDFNLGYTRTDKLVFIQIFQQGRDAATKQKLYGAIAERLQEECELAGDDLFISVNRNEKEDWSIGRGRATFLVGDV